MMGVGYGTAHFCLQIRISSDFFLSSDVCALAENDLFFFFKPCKGKKEKTFSFKPEL